MDFYEQCRADADKNSGLKVDALLQALPKKDADSLRKALLDDSISTRAIVRVLEENNYKCGMWAINKWRKEHDIILKTTHMIKDAK